MDEGAKNSQWRKDNPFSKWCWENWMFTQEKEGNWIYLMPIRKINTKWIKEGVPFVAQWKHTRLLSLLSTIIHEEDAGSIPGLAQWVKHPV